MTEINPEYSTTRTKRKNNNNNKERWSSFPFFSFSFSFNLDIIIYGKLLDFPFCIITRKREKTFKKSTLHRCLIPIITSFLFFFSV